MTKILRVGKKETKVTNQMISKIGETLYHNEGINSVQIKINFQDGTVVGYKKMQEEDDWEDFFKGDDE